MRTLLIILILAVCVNVYIVIRATGDLIQSQFENRPPIVVDRLVLDIAIGQGGRLYVNEDK